VFGLGVNDIEVASFHGTSTTANDLNETHVLNMQMEHLGRTAGNVLPAIMQKYLTGHPKGAAAAWMVNGVLQVLDSGVIPGNRNADNIDEKLKEYDYVHFPSRSIQTDGVKAGLLKSFGFGQVGGEVLLIHPNYVLAALTEKEFDTYRAKRERRQEKSYRHLHDSLAGVAPFVQVKTTAPYTDDDAHAVYLNPNARARYNDKKKVWGISAKQNGFAYGQAPNKESVEMSKALMQLSGAHQQGDERGVGVDIELLSAIDITNETFIERNFTEEEKKYCLAASDPHASFTGRWSAKEAVIKAISNSTPPGTPQVWKGAGAGLKEIEIVPSDNGSPQVRFHGEAAAIVEGLKIKSVKVSISHSGAYAVAMATAL